MSKKLHRTGLPAIGCWNCDLVDSTGQSDGGRESSCRQRTPAAESRGSDPSSSGRRADGRPEGKRSQTIRSRALNWRFFRLKPKLIVIPSGELRVVRSSESHSPALRATPDGQLVVQLIREPTNSADKNAIQLRNQHGPLGYLTPVDARRYAKTLDRVRLPLFAHAVQQETIDGKGIWVGMPTPCVLNAWLNSVNCL
jgi:hypothetical protein